MKNQAPIILNCFSRGGSNILWNILLSHPEVCSPIQETLEIFRLDRSGVRVAGLKAAWLTHQFKFFNQWHFKNRKPISIGAKTYIDHVLYQWKLKTIKDEEMKFKTADQFYSPEEVAVSRLVLKNNNGTIFLSDVFKEMYPDVTFFGLVREPLSLYESHKRRNTPPGASPGKFADYYQTMIKKMLSDKKKWDNYHILRFEDLLANPIASIKDIYHLANLELEKVESMRFKAKRHMHANGNHKTTFKEGHHYWFPFSELDQILEPKVNKYQISRLTEEESCQVKTLTAGICQEIGYH